MSWYVGRQLVFRHPTTDSTSYWPLPADYIPFRKFLIDALYVAGVLISVTVRYLPAWMPGGSFKREASYWQPFVDEMFKRPYHDVKDALVSLTKDDEGFITDLSREFRRMGERRRPS